MFNRGTIHLRGGGGGTKIQNTLHVTLVLAVNRVDRKSW